MSAMDGIATHEHDGVRYIGREENCKGRHDPTSQVVTGGASASGRLAGLPFAIGDTVERIGNPGETAEVIYVSAAYDYAELRYPNAALHNCFRARKSEWQRVSAR